MVDSSARAYSIPVLVSESLHFFPSLSNHWRPLFQLACCWTTFEMSIQKPCLAKFAAEEVEDRGKRKSLALEEQDVGDRLVAAKPQASFAIGELRGRTMVILDICGKLEYGILRIDDFERGTQILVPNANALGWDEWLVSDFDLRHRRETGRQKSGRHDAKKEVFVHGGRRHLYTRDLDKTQDKDMADEDFVKNKIIRVFKRGAAVKQVHNTMQEIETSI
ncbi:hypothetical protein B0H17DRAFT_1137679 [Mycena rosella]|uniref:Uncharacterized protein n=1 Tax=Mycena rosella TaxID=1033263 RepID=A0AAD7D857_MYCRO|nr:hypothetical protein B0H17DRAFT_1137679 [Mycena rosella]